MGHPRKPFGIGCGVTAIAKNGYLYYPFVGRSCGC